MNRLLIIVLVVAAITSACTLLTSFYPEGQPCDNVSGSDMCLVDAGYRCVNKVCTRDAGQ